MFVYFVFDFRDVGGVEVDCDENDLGVDAVLGLGEEVGGDEDGVGGVVSDYL